MGDWAEKYGWAIPALAVGIIIGVLLVEKTASFRTISSFGTLGAAIAAFWAVYLNSQDQRRKRAQDEQAQRPYLIISDAEFETPGMEWGQASITFTNLSQYPIHVRDAVVHTDDGLPDVITVGLLIPPYETTTYETVYNVHFIEAGGLEFMFNYAPTGPILYSLLLPYRSDTEPESKELEQLGLPKYPHTLVSFMPADQRLETNVEDRAKLARKFVEEIYR